MACVLGALPGIASVLRSPVADALVRAIKGAAGIGEFTVEDAEELIRYAVRRGLIGADEVERVLTEAQDALKTRKPLRPAKVKGMPKTLPGGWKKKSRHYTPKTFPTSRTLSAASRTDP